MNVLVEFLSLSVAVVILLRAARFGYFSPYFLVMLHLVMGVVVRYFYLKYFPDRALTQFLNIDWVDLLELLIAILLISLTLEISLSVGRETIYVSIFRFKSKGFSVSGLRLSLVICVGALVIYLLGMMSVFGGFFQFIYARSARLSEDMQGLGYLGALSNFFLVGVLVLLSLDACGKAKLLSPVKSFLVVASFLLLGVQGARGNLIQFVIGLFMVSAFSRGKITKFDWRVIPLMVGGAFVIVLGLSNRYASQLNIEFSEALDRVSENIIGALLSPFALLDHYALSKVYVNEEGVDFGFQYISLFSKVIPRSLWSDKPLSLDLSIRQYFWGDTLGGVPPGLLGEFYLAGGVLGVFFISIIFGLILARLQKIFEACKADSSFLPYLVVIVPYFSFSLIRGGFDVGFVRIAICLFCLAFYAWIIRLKIGFGKESTWALRKNQ